MSQKFYRPKMTFRLAMLLLIFFARSPASGRSSSIIAAEEKSDVKFTLESNGRHGNYYYLPAHWGELQLRLENQSQDPRDLFCVSNFTGHPALQFGRRVWMPPQSRLSISHPALFPKEDEIENHVAVVHSLLMDQSSGPGSEVLIRGDNGQLRNEHSLMMAPSARNTGIITGWSLGDEVPQDILDLVRASRVQQGLDNRVVVLGSQFLYADETSWNELDHLVIAEDRLLDDFAAMTAVRRWVYAGGRLWVMLDRADPTVLARLLGDEFHGALVDRVSLSTVQINQTPTPASPKGAPGEVVQYEEPVELARVFISGMKALNTVNGWPVAMTKTYGSGRILVTTLGPRAWIKPRPPVVGKQPEPPPEKRTDYVPNSAMEYLAAFALAPREPDLLPRELIESISQEYISYKVPSWSFIASTIGGFLALLFVLAIIFWKWNRIEHFGWIGTLLAVLFGAGLTGMGVMQRYGIPGTIASVELALPVPGTGDVRTQGMLTVYHPEGNPASVQSTQGGTLWPPKSLSNEESCRIVTEDLGVFSWDGYEQPTGLSVYQEEQAWTLKEPLAAIATMDGNGLSGKVASATPFATEALLATRFGRVSVRVGPDGSFTASAEDVLELDQFFDSSFIGDEQDRRLRILQQLFSNVSWKNGLTNPQVLLWSNDWDHGFQFGENLKHDGVTLISVPLELHRPEAGSQIVIPSPLLGFSITNPPDGSIPAGFWDDDHGEWQERSEPSSIWLAFHVPSDLLPVLSTKARVNLKVSGAPERIEILGVKDGVAVSLKTVDNPSGTTTLELNDVEALTISERGELVLGFNVGRQLPAGDSSDPQSNPNTASSNLNTGSIQKKYWKIDSLALQLWATVEQPTE